MGLIIFCRSIKQAFHLTLKRARSHMRLRSGARKERSQSRFAGRRWTPSRRKSTSWLTRVCHSSKKKLALIQLKIFKSKLRAFSLSLTRSQWIFKHRLMRSKITSTVSNTFINWRLTRPYPIFLSIVTKTATSQQTWTCIMKMLVVILVCAAQVYFTTSFFSSKRGGGASSGDINPFARGSIWSVNLLTYTITYFT